jgi:hypothetical protein
MAAGVRSVRWPPPARLACLAVAVFLAGEGRLRKDGDARSLDAAPSDRGTTAAIGAVFPLAVLGASYTRTLRTRDGQAVLTTGLYAHVRHPGYAGTLSLLLGYALSWQTPAGLLPFLPMIPVYSRRMSAEERLLETELGDSYGRYRRRTRRLLPGIY